MSNQSENLRMSRDIAKSAICFDDLRSAPIGSIVWHEAMAAAKWHIEKMHAIGIKLAGDQVGLVYDQEEAPKEAVAA